LPLDFGCLDRVRVVVAADLARAPAGRSSVPDVCLPVGLYLPLGTRACAREEQIDVGLVGVDVGWSW
jgi:hypothetical protein